ncbi:MAG TPA: hypothetical protein DG761_04065 [Gammaproteobacteria bacterium]|jgi:hypothetical protein|nr:hypothetical protein [Acidiferrobacteraceae bacterium]MDP6397393.1 penicillin-binding protein activator [Arenicellales bacterium]HCX87177.1 hypothetical protein [Gammaproteobacteria bacterium]MDP6551735.1 penicillin-binding protein activator [Arenicellales bacterium]MDP6791475.1 penicillin-binding protein activator [Arenicellales bacterium]|tara:strand:- start:27142 stop:29082 length:1941 start_codon:yes stop_codon:yes gene_type:complete
MPSHCAAGLLRALTVALVLGLVSGCLGPATKDTVDRQDSLKPAPAAQAKETVKDANKGTATPVNRDLAEAHPESSAWTFLERALDAKDAQAEMLFLAAAKRFLQVGHYEQAEIILARTQARNAESWVNDQHKLLSAALTLAGENPSAAWRLLADTEDAELDNGQRLLRYDLQFRTLFAQEKHHEALALIRNLSLEDSTPEHIDALLQSAFDRLSRLSTDQLDLLRLNPDIVYEDAGWIDLARLYGRTGWNLEGLRQELDGWLAEYPAHRATTIARRLRPETCSLAEPSTVALLLPMTSSFSKAASAFHDGYLSLYETDNPSARPIIELYDFGEDLEAVGNIYRQAVAAGSDLVIGPLGRDAVFKLVAESKLLVPTLLLGSDDSRSRPNALILDLSRRVEAQSLVTHARSRGLQHALILYSLSKVHKAAADTAATAWQERGGIIAGRAGLNPQVSDYSAILSRLLGLTQSQQRAEALQSILADQVPVTAPPRIRQDLDVIFLFTDQATARLLKPQIDFHHAGRLPVYSQNTIFSGKADVVNDLDLEGVLFSDMPWLVRQTGRFERAPADSIAATDYQHSAIGRLFALGMDAYRLTCHISKRQDQPDWQYAGASGLLSISGDGQIKRLPDWATFNKGSPQMFEPVISR